MYGRDSAGHGKGAQPFSALLPGAGCTRKAAHPSSSGPVSPEGHGVKPAGHRSRSAAPHTPPARSPGPLSGGSSVRSQRLQSTAAVSLCSQKRLLRRITHMERAQLPARGGAKRTYFITHFPKSTVFFVECQKPVVIKRAGRTAVPPARRPFISPAPLPAEGSVPAHPSAAPGTRPPPSRAPAAPLPHPE